MPTSYTTLLGLSLPVQGELSGTWGNEVNNYITNYLDASVAGTQTITTDADVTLTKTTGASLSATSSQYAVINCTGARTGQRNITAPAASKLYTVINATTGGYAVVIRGAGPTTGVSIAAGESAQVAWNGTDFIKVSNANGTGTFTNLNVSGAATFSAGTANGVTYLNGSKVLTSGSTLTFNGTRLGVNSATPAVTTELVGTDALLIPKGTTAQQPTGVAGYLRFNTTTTRFEGYNGSAWASVGGAAISNDTSTSTNIYPISASATSGTALTVYTSNAKFLYKPSTGELQANQMVSTNGIVVNSNTVSSSYSIPSGSNAMSTGPITIASGQSVTVPTGSRWLIL